MWVSYPKDKANGKHDVLCEQWPLPHSFTEFDEKHAHLYISSMEKLKESLATKASHRGKELITTIYSYSDSPNPETNGEPVFSHPLIIIGFVPNDIVSDLLNQSFQECTIAVKLSYGEHKKRLKKQDVVKSGNFIILMKKLKETEFSAVIACDKYKRALFLSPCRMNTSSDEAPSTQRDNYAGVCYYGKFDSIQDFIQNQNEWVPTSPPYPPPDDDDDDWVPASPPYPPNDEYMNSSPPWKADNSTNENDEGPLWNPETPPMDDDLQFRPETPPMEDDKTNEDDGNGLWKPDAPNGDSEVPLWEVPDNMPTSSFSDVVPSFQTEENNEINENNENNENNNEDDNFHKNKGAAAADEFYSGLTRNLDTRADSRLFHMRAFNGWVKATQIAELNPRIIEDKKPTKKRARLSANMTCKLNILDLACGKGGDLNKWILQKRGMDNYVGVDVARGSLVDAAKRAKELGSNRRLSKARFVCADLGADVPSRKKDKLLTWIMDLEKEGTWMDPKFEFLPGGGISKNDRFHVVSIQFAIHYMMQTRERARRFFKTVSDLLEIGGNLIATTVDTRVVMDHLMGMGLNLQEKPKDNVTVVVGGGVCRFKFEPDIIEKIFLKKEKFGLEYTFTLVEGDDHGAGVGEAVDLPEWLIPIPVLEELAEEAGLELEEYENFHDFYKKRKDPFLFPSAHNALYNMKVLDRTGSISKEEWSVSRVYVAVKFTKVRESKIILEEEEEEEDEPMEPLKPPSESLKKSKLVPMAMMKAKKAFGNKWNSLTAEEKKRLTNLELEKM